MSEDKRTVPPWVDWALRVMTALALGLGSFVFVGLSDTVTGIEHKLQPLADAIGDLNTQLKVDAADRKHRDDRIDTLELELERVRSEQQRRTNRVETVTDLERRIAAAEALLTGRAVTLRDLRRDIETAAKDRFYRRDFDRWALRLSRANPELTIPDLGD